MVWCVVWPPQILGEQREFIDSNGSGSGLTTGHEMNRVNTASKGSSQNGLMGYHKV